MNNKTDNGGINSGIVGVKYFPVVRSQPENLQHKGGGVTGVAKGEGEHRTQRVLSVHSTPSFYSENGLSSTDVNENNFVYAVNGERVASRNC